jgi:hypothetical protein
VQLDLRTLVMAPSKGYHWPKFPFSDVVLLCEEDAQEAASACRLVVPQTALEELPQMLEFRIQIHEKEVYCLLYLALLLACARFL